MILKPKILKNVKDVEYMDDFDDWYIFKENPSDYTELPKNMILYGPPGTGKTYHTVLYAVAIIEEKSLAEVASEPYEDIAKRYHHYKENGLIEFTTFLLVSLRIFVTAQSNRFKLIMFLLLMR